MDKSDELKILWFDEKKKPKGWIGELVVYGVFPIMNTNTVRSTSTMFRIIEP